MTTTQTAEPTDELLDAVADALTDTAVPPSALARKAKVRTSEAGEALRWLVEHRFATPVGHGAWTRYRKFDAYSDLRGSR